RRAAQRAAGAMMRGLRGTTGGEWRAASGPEPGRASSPAAPWREGARVTEPGRAFVRPPTKCPGLAVPGWNEERRADRSRVAPRLRPPTNGADLADPGRNAERRADRSRVAPTS